MADVERRLVAIFAADVEGYSRLMGKDEVAGCPYRAPGNPGRSANSALDNSLGQRHFSQLDGFPASHKSGLPGLTREGITMRFEDDVIAS
jgi:hypothetical protein